MWLNLHFLKCNFRQTRQFFNSKAFHEFVASVHFWKNKAEHADRKSVQLLITFLRCDRDIDVVLFTNDIDMILYHISGEYLYWQRWPAQSHFIFTFGVCLFLSLLWHCLLRQDGYNNIASNDFKQSKSRFWQGRCHLSIKGRARKDQNI